MGLGHDHYRLQSYIRADKAGKLIGRDLSKALEARDLGFGAQLFDGGIFFVFVVTVDRFLFIAHPEQGRFQYIDMPVFHQVGKELEEKGHQQKPDMHAVYIRIGGDDDVVVPEMLIRIFDVQRVLQEVKFLVLVNHFFGKPETVQGFASQAEYRLRLDVPCLGNGAAGRIALRDKNGAFPLLFQYFSFPFAFPVFFPCPSRRARRSGDSGNP